MSSAAERKLPTAGEVIDRMRAALGLKSDGDLASLLGIAKTTVSSWRRRNSIPYAECVELALRGAARLEWLLTGEGRRGDSYYPEWRVNPIVLAKIIEMVEDDIARSDDLLIKVKDKATMIAQMYERYAETKESLVRTGRFDEEAAARLRDEIAPRALEDVPRDRRGQ